MQIGGAIYSVVTTLTMTDCVLANSTADDEVSSQTYARSYAAPHV